MRIVRLTDPELKPKVDARMKELLSDPKKAEAWLKALHKKCGIPWPPKKKTKGVLKSTQEGR